MQDLQEEELSGRLWAVATQVLWEEKGMVVLGRLPWGEELSGAPVAMGVQQHQWGMEPPRSLAAMESVDHILWVEEPKRRRLVAIVVVPSEPKKK